MLRVSGIRNQLIVGDQEDMATGTGATGPVAAHLWEDGVTRGRAVYRVSRGSTNTGGEGGGNFVGYIAQTHAFSLTF